MRVVRAIVAVVAALVALPTAVAAHSELVETVPAAGSRLEAPPREIVLTFDGELVPDGSGFAITAPDGSAAGEGELDLQVAERNVLRGDVTVSAQGTYTVEWTAVAPDGHPQSGTFTFDYGAASPDTRVPAPDGPNLLVLAGVLLLAGSVAWALLRGRRRSKTR